MCGGSMMKEMLVERVMRAIAQADERNGGPPYEYRITLSKHAKEHLRDQAIAAIEACAVEHDDDR